jgi:glucose-6-phosphate 1-dehydrogenase
LANLLVLQTQPEERITLGLAAKVPGPRVRLGNVMMDFNYVDAFGKAPQTGYETLLYDCMNGDQTLFQRADQIEAAWSVVEPILDVWKALPPKEFPNYAAGSWGPPEAQDLLTSEGRKWWNTAPFHQRKSPLRLQKSVA